MKLALQEGLYEDGGFANFVRRAAEWGFDAVEVWGEGLAERIEEVKRVVASAGMPVSSVCPGGGGIRGSLLAQDEDERKAAAADIGALLELCAELGGAGLILVPEFGSEKFMALYPDLAGFDRRKGLFVERLEPLARKARSLGVDILLEPLNRYEAYFLLTVGQAAELCRLCDNTAVKIMADLFHMGIEENSLLDALSKNSEHIAHVHLVDTNRKLPGLGSRDFPPVLRTLKEQGFDGCLCLECGIPGDPAADIPASVDYVRKILDSL